MGLYPADIRYTADSAATAGAAKILLPVRVIAWRPTTEQALTEARQVVEQFRLLCDTAQHAGGQLTLGDLATSFEKHSGRLTVQQYSKKEVQLELEFLAVVGFSGPADFWGRAAVVAWGADVVQGFCLRSWPKGVKVIARRGKFLAEPPTSDEVVGVPGSSS
jgi:hypothetical protein